MKHPKGKKKRATQRPIIEEEDEDDQIINDYFIPQRTSLFVAGKFSNFSNLPKINVSPYTPYALISFFYLPNTLSFYLILILCHRYQKSIPLQTSR